MPGFGVATAKVSAWLGGYFSGLGRRVVSQSWGLWNYTRPSVGRFLSRNCIARETHFEHWVRYKVVVWKSWPQVSHFTTLTPFAAHCSLVQGLPLLFIEPSAVVPWIEQ